MKQWGTHAPQSESSVCSPRPEKSPRAAMKTQNEKQIHFKNKESDGEEVQLPLVKTGTYGRWWLTSSFLERLNLSLSRLGKASIFSEEILEYHPSCQNQIFDSLKREKISSYLLKDCRWKIFKNQAVGLGGRFFKEWSLSGPILYSV